MLSIFDIFSYVGKKYFSRKSKTSKVKNVFKSMQKRSRVYKYDFIENFDENILKNQNDETKKNINFLNNKNPTINIK